MSALMLDVDQAGELKAAFRRGDWTNAEIKLLCEGDRLAEVRSYVCGLAEIKLIPRILDCSSLFNLKEFLGEGWDVVEQDERALALTQVDFTQIQFVTGLKEKETSIKGEEKLRRLKEEQPSLIRHGGNQFLALWQDYQKNGADSVLEGLRKTKGIIYLDFLGLILRGPRGHWCVLFLYWRGDSWDWHYRWLARDWRVRRFSVASPAS